MSDKGGRWIIQGCIRKVMYDTTIHVFITRMLLQTKIDIVYIIFIIWCKEMHKTRKGVCDEGASMVFGIVNSVDGDGLFASLLL